MEHKYFLIRIIFALILFFLMTLNALTNFAITNEFPKSIVDYTQSLFTGFYVFFKRNENTKKFFLISIGVIVDFGTLLVSFAWIKYSKSWRSLIIFISYIFLQSVSKFLFKIKIPEQNLMQYPGIPSLIISYNNESNNFFLGSLGLNLFSAIELRAYFNIHIIFRIVSYLSFINIILEIFVYYSLNCIYLVDIICPIVGLLYCIMMTKDVWKYFDEKLIISHDDSNEAERYEEFKNIENGGNKQNIKKFLATTRDSLKSARSQFSNVTIVDIDAAVNSKFEK